MPAPPAFTVTAKGRIDHLPSPCHIKPAELKNAEFRQFNALWDTGATRTAITQDVVNQCGLKPVGKTRVFHAGMKDEPDETNVYVVDIRLPNKVLIPDVIVSLGGFRGGQVLIGMDIISQGDFAITHPNGNTQFTFQIPAQADINFVEKQPLPPPQNRRERRARERSQRRRNSN